MMKREALYHKLRGLSVIFFFIFLMSFMKTLNFNSNLFTGAISYGMQLGLMEFLLITTATASLTAILLRKRLH